jgi:hypothetical protein
MGKIRLLPRVQGLGEVSPIGRLFTSGISFISKIADVAQIFGPFFSVKIMYYF